MRRIYDEIEFILDVLSEPIPAVPSVGIELDKPQDWLEFQASVAVLSHALLFIISLFAASHGVTHVAVCQSAPGITQVEHIERGWAPMPHPNCVHVYTAFRARDAAPLRVLGRCVLKPAPEDQQPVLFGSFALQVDQPDDENFASARAETKAPFARPAAVGARPTAMYVLRAPRTQLERPPRV